MNGDILRARFLCRFLALLVATGCLAPGAGRSAEPSLREAYQSQFPIGVALDGMLPGEYSARELALVRQQFAVLTPANGMKMTWLQRRPGQFDFAMADALVAFAASNRLQVCGHTLVWAKDERTPPWFFRDGTNAVSRERLLQRMQQHIDTVAGRYRGRVISWDVVNEPLDDEADYLRPSQWVRIAGEEFIAKAFEFAHAADPDAVLFLNDYNIELPAKREKLLRLLRRLKEQNVPVHAVGLQGHFELDAVPFEDVEATIAAIAALGLKVAITECDIDVIPRARWWAEGGRHREELRQVNPYPDGCPADVLQRQAGQYARLFAIFRRHRQAIARVTFWDLHDGRSWLNHFPWERVNHPLLFDRDANPKPAFEAVLSAK